MSFPALPSIIFLVALSMDRFDVNELELPFLCMDSAAPRRLLLLLDVLVLGPAEAPDCAMLKSCF
jgi:hypothetical protein